MTTTSKRNPEKLQQLAWDANIVQLAPLVKLRRRDHEIPNFVSGSDEQNANQLVFSERSNGFLRKPTIRTKSRLSSYTYKNLTVALAKAFDSGYGAGVVQALLGKDQDIGAIKNDETRKTQLEQRDALLTRAIQSGNSDIVWVVAPKASPTARNDGLRLALKHRDEAIIKKLLECAAEPRIASKEFLDAAEKGDLPIIELLLSAPHSLPNASLQHAIPGAVASGSLQALQRIVEFTNFDGWFEPAAIRLALIAARLDMLLVLLFAARQVKPDFLAKEILELYQRPQASRAVTAQLLQAVLYAGAAGNECSATLRIAAENQDIDTIRMLISSGTDVNWGQGVILKDLARSGRVDLMRAALEGSNVSADSASSAVANLPKNMPEVDRLEMLTVLIDFGARGRPLEDEVVLSVQRSHSTIVQLLRSKGVSVDNRAGDALVAAIQVENLASLNTLLEGPVDQISLQNAFPYTQNVSKARRVDFMRPLLEAQVEGNVLHVALRDIVAEHTTDGVDEAIDALLLAQADPSFEDCQSLKTAVRSTNTELFARLLQCPVGISESVASSLIPEVLRIRKLNVRLILMRSVLQARPKADSVSAAMLMLLGEQTCETELIELFVASGMVDVNYKTILAQAAINLNVQALSAVAQLSDTHRDTMASAVTKLLEAQVFSDDERFQRLRLLFSSARSSVRSHGANIGLPVYVKSWQGTGQPGKFWPLKVFEYLLASGASPSSSTLLADVVGSGAVYLVKAFLVQQTVKLQIDDAITKIFQVAENEQVEMLEALLQAKPSKHVLSAMLVTAVDGNNQAVCKVLLDNGARLDFEDCIAIRRAASKPNERLVGMILTRAPPAAVVVAAFDEAKGLQDSQQKLNIMRMLFDTGALKNYTDPYLLEVLGAEAVYEGIIRLLLIQKANPAYDQYRPIVVAATRNDLEVVKILFGYTRDRAGAATKAFEVLVSNNSITVQFMSILLFLLEHGANGPALDTALIQAMQTYSQNPGILKFIELLVQSGADVNASQGNALCLACGLGQLEPVKALFKALKCPNVVSRSRALQYLVDSSNEANDFCTILDLLMQNPVENGDSRLSEGQPKFTCRPGMESPLQRFLKIRPQDQLALEMLLNCGCEALHKVTDDSILIWAMCQAPPRVSLGCLKLLIEAGANVKCRSQLDDETTLHAAIRTGRGCLVKPLLDRGVDLFAANNAGVSPLLMATRHGDAQAADTLMASGSPKDDGSLHEAVCLLQLDVVETLLKHGHNPNFPSQLSDGRSALAQLLFQGRADQNNLLIVRNTIDLLLDNGAETMKPVSRKPLICWALDNAQPIYMVSALLQAYLYKYIDADFNIYHENGFFYSPTMYVGKGKCAAPQTYAIELQTLLKNFGANRDVYYHDLGGAQPPDAIGMPDAIAHAERARREAAAEAEQARKQDEEAETRREQAHKRALARKQELVQAEIAGSGKRFRIEQQMAEEAEKAEQKRMRGRHSVQLQLQADTEQQRMNFRRREDEYQDGRRKEDLQHQKRLADDEFNAYERKEQLRLTTQQGVEASQQRLLKSNIEQEYAAQVQLERLRLDTQKQLESSQAAAVKTQTDDQRKMIAYQDTYSEKAHKRKMSEIAMQKAVVSAYPVNARIPGGFIEG